ncbi:MAG: hypothetical protein LQ344_006526 [Seirophora lacunosa]|nr:MAG: hypothetical protein LQ344_006526 [Seirophora lacunosa]
MVLSRYIDGVGFCLGGRRQERYCPNCQVFWDTRIAASGTPQTTTRIPDHPDQSDFINQWFDWHRGYTIIDRQDGTQERKELIGDTLSEVDIGRLPRTLEQLQAPAQRHRLQRRRSASSTQIPSSDAYNGDERFHTHFINRHEHVTNASINASQAVVAPRIDPEDRIFDSPSSSASSVDSYTEDHEVDTVPARQQLFSNLQESLDDIRANVLELTQRTPEARNSSQVLAVTDQINSISGRITRIRQQNLARLQHQQNTPFNWTLSSPRQDSTDADPAVEENGDVSLAASRTARNYLISDEALRQHIMALNREESEARATILASEELLGGREAAVSHLNSITRQRQQAEQERARRERLSHMFGTLGDRQGAEERNPITSLFARQVPNQPEPQDYLTRYNNSVAASENESQDYNRIWTSRIRPSRGAHASTFDPLTHGYYGFSGM